MRSIGKPRGILSRSGASGRTWHRRHLPSDELQYFVEHFWLVSWDFRGEEPYLVETLPHPSVHLVIEKGSARVGGVMRGKFSTLLAEEGRVFGIKFKPGAFHPFLGAPVSTLTDRQIPVVDLFGDDGKDLEDEIVREEDDGSMVAIAERFLRARLPERDANVELVGNLVERILDDRSITKVEELAELAGMNTRTLQRLFSRYVGVSPKWVIQRYRLHEAVEQLAPGVPIDWPKLALDLGYFDQAHFIRDFKGIIGVPPSEYVRGRGG